MDHCKNLVTSLLGWVKREKLARHIKNFLKEFGIIIVIIVASIGYVIHRAITILIKNREMILISATSGMLGGVVSGIVLHALCP